MKESPEKAFAAAALKAKTLSAQLGELENAVLHNTSDSPSRERLITEGSKAVRELERVLHVLSPQRFGSVAITLGRANGIAKFFAFSFVATEKRKLTTLTKNPFWGSGVYAIYYHGTGEAAYIPLSGTETPIYVGKADPANAFSETIEAQGQALFRRLREHATNIAKTELSLADFSYRVATIQSGMQVAVEEFMIRLFRPIWNKSVGVCHGLGKHGDSAMTRANKRSPWDTMHPGRKWALDTKANQSERHDIVARIGTHFATHPIIIDKAQLFDRLSLD